MRVEQGRWKLEQLRSDGFSIRNGRLVKRMPWAPEDHRFRPYSTRVTLKSVERERIGFWDDGEAITDTVAWLRETIGSTAHLWTAQMVIDPKGRDALQVDLYFASPKHAAAFVAHWSNG